MGPPRAGHSVRSVLLRIEFPILILSEGMKVTVYVTGTVHSPLQQNCYWVEGPIASDGLFKSPSL